ncbi:MAG TPA: hypothetical protein VG387_04480 [Rhizomicrobium sp.]|nr:hypothetical protein [Rhizomicrobium sp.]
MTKLVVAVAGGMTLAAGAAHASTAPMTTAAPTATIGSMDDLRTRALAGQVRPSEVADAMKALGMDLVHSPVTNVLGNASLNPSAGERLSLLVCNSSHWCVVVKPALTMASQGPATASSAAALVADRIARREDATVGDVLAELDSMTAPGERWTVGLAGNGQVVIG